MQARAVLVFKAQQHDARIRQAAMAVEAHRAAQSVLSLTVVQTDRHAATEFGAL